MRKHAQGDEKRRRRQRKRRSTGCGSARSTTHGKASFQRLCCRHTGCSPDPGRCALCPHLFLAACRLLTTSSSLASCPRDRRLFAGCRRGILPRTTDRLSDAERKSICSGDIFVFSEEQSKIKRCALPGCRDGANWLLTHVRPTVASLSSDGQMEGAGRPAGS